MPKCKMCDRKGIFLRVTKNGLCKYCEPVLIDRVTQQKRIMTDCMNIIDKSKNADTKLSRCDLLLNHLDDLYYYEERGIDTIKPAPSGLLIKYKNIRNDIVIEKERTAIEKEFNKANKSKTPKTKIKYAKLALNKLNEFKENKDELSLSANSLKEFEILEKSINDLVSTLNNL